MAEPRPEVGQSTFETALPTRTTVQTGQPVTPGFWMPDHDYTRLVARMRDIEPELQWPVHVAAALAALVPAIGLTLIPWLATFPTLSDEVQRQWGWVTGAMAMAIVSCLLGIILCAFAWWRSRGRRTRDIASVIEDMEAVEAAARAGATISVVPGTIVDDR